MKASILAIFLFYSAIATGSSISDYFHLVDEAELLLCDGKPELALQHYNKAFSKKEQPFGKDVLNAWICAYQVNNIESFKIFSVVLIKRGAFLNEKVHIAMLKNVPCKSDINKYSDLWLKLKSTIKSEVDTAYASKLKTLVDEDQKARHYFIGQYGKQYNVGGRDSLDIFDSLNVLNLKDLFDNLGLPTEDRIGYDFNQPANPPIYEIILRHDRSWNNRRTLDSFIYTKVLTGSFPPFIYAFWKDKSYLKFQDSISSYQVKPYTRYGTEKLIVINNTLYIEKFTDGETNKIDEARKAIYLEPLAHLYVKAKFHFSHKYYFFLNGMNFSNWEGMPEDEIQQISNNSYSDQEIAAFDNISTDKCIYGLKHK